MIKVDGSELRTAYLGAGRHCKAWRVCDEQGPLSGQVVCVVDEDEYMKETVSQFCDPLPHLPVIAHHDDVETRGEFRQVYSMPYYRDVKASDREAWSVLKLLATTAAELLPQFSSPRIGQAGEKSLVTHGYDFAQAIIEATRGKVPETVTEALEELSNAGSNYGCGVTFEFGKRNIGVDAAGRIVFRDILFDAEKLQRQIVAARRQSRGY